MREKKYNQIDNITTGRNIYTLRHSLDREITEFTILSQSPDDPDPGLYIPSSTTRLLNLANLWVRLSMYLMASRMMSSCVTFSLIQRLGSSCWSLECWQQWRSWPSNLPTIYLPSSDFSVWTSSSVRLSMTEDWASPWFSWLSVSPSTTMTCWLWDGLDWTGVRAVVRRICIAGPPLGLHRYLTSRPAQVSPCHDIKLTSQTLDMNSLYFERESENYYYSVMVSHHLDWCPAFSLLLLINYLQMRGAARNRV